MLVARAAKQVRIFNLVANGGENGLGGWEAGGDTMRPKRMR